MTENKRFYVAESNLIDGYCVFDKEKKYAFHPRQRKADCLNDVHILNELNDENNELRQELNCEKPLFTKKRLHQENQELTDEIHKIKNTIQEAYKTERTDLGKSVLKQLMEQIQ